MFYSIAYRLHDPEHGQRENSNWTLHRNDTVQGMWLTNLLENFLHVFPGWFHLKPIEWDYVKMDKGVFFLICVFLLLLRYNEYLKLERLVCTQLHQSENFDKY